MSTVKKKKKMRTRDKVMLTVSIIMIVISILALVGVFLMNSSIFQDPNVGGGGMTNSYVTPTEIKDKTMNFLICGIDNDPTQKGRGGKLSDVIMVANYDISAKKVNILQIPRDTYVSNDYPTGKTNKINAIYNQASRYKTLEAAQKAGYKAEGGINGLIAAIYNNFKLPIDHYVTITMDSFRDVVDALGGIEVDSPFAFTRNGQKIVKGKQMMDGKKAEVFVRERKLVPGGDAGRQRSQRAFLSGLMDALLEATPDEIVKMVPTLIKEVGTDMTPNEMIDLAKAAQGLKKENIVFHSMPGSSGYYKVSSGQKLSIFSMNKEKAAELLNTYFRPHSDAVPAAELGIVQVFDKVSVEDNPQGMDDTGAQSKTSSGSKK